MDDLNKIRERISERGLKITPQRVAVFEAIENINEHPTAEIVKKRIGKTSFYFFWNYI